MSTSSVYPADANAYKRLDEIGHGVWSTVYKGLCTPLNEIVAIKILKADKCSENLKQVDLMSSLDNSNLLKAHCSFINGDCLWIVTPYMSGGSCLNIMKSDYPEGLEQPVIVHLLREVLKALVFLHVKGHIHYGIKAGNILVDAKGSVKLGDLGVLSTNTVFRSPSWMPPEIMQQVLRVDIWLFGITALELAHVHAYSSMEVRLLKSYATKLLKDPLFKDDNSTKSFFSTFFKGLSPLEKRYRKMKEKEAKLLEYIDGSKEKLSQREYLKESLAWNIDHYDLRKQAALDIVSRGDIQLTEAQSPPSTSPLQLSLGEHVDIFPSGSDDKQMEDAETDPDKLKNDVVLTSGNTASLIDAAQILPMLENLLQQNESHRETLKVLIKCCGGKFLRCKQNPIFNAEGGQISREAELESEVSSLQQRQVNRLSKMRFPLNAKDYELFEEIGVGGARATVRKAKCIINCEIVAIKIYYLEKCMNDLETIRKQVDLMSLIDHPNLLSAHCSFIDGNNLWIVMPFMSGGSCLDIMKSVYPQGLEETETVIAHLLREVLKALVCLHEQGYIHHDVKAGNILVDDKGTIKLGNFGVLSANTFFGPPSWMPPEMMQHVDRVDIWSFGVTALELAHGHAIFSKHSLRKVLDMTFEHTFSKSFKTLVGACLVKDSNDRPTAAKLLEHPFFKLDLSSKFKFNGFSPQEKEDAKSDGSKGKLSQRETYLQKTSSWSFGLEALKIKIAMLPDDVVGPENKNYVKPKPKKQYFQANFLHPHNKRLRKDVQL